MILPDSHAIKLVNWMAIAPAREVESVARLGLTGVWPGHMRRSISIEYIMRALRPVYSYDQAAAERVREELVRRSLLPEEFELPPKNRNGS